MRKKGLKYLAYLKIVCRNHIFVTIQVSANLDYVLKYSSSRNQKRNNALRLIYE